MLRRVPYDPERPLVVRRPFDGYRIGDEFDASRCNFRRTAQLYNSAYIIHSDGPALIPVAYAIREERVKPPVAVQAEPEIAPVEPEATVALEPAVETGIEFIDTGYGWFNVQLAGVVINDKKIKGLEAAKAWATEQGYC